MSVALATYGALPADTGVAYSLRPLRKYMDMPGVTEVCVNQPGEVFTKTAGLWERFEVPELSFVHCCDLARDVATLTGQFTGERNPLLGAPLPTGERAQFVQPPATLPEAVGIVIRCPSLERRRIEDSARQGLYARLGRQHQRGLKPHEEELLDLKKQGRFLEFMGKAVRAHQTIAVVGKTGSGKTDYIKQLCEEIPADERLVTIEDVWENRLPAHKNKLHLFFSKNNQGVSTVSPGQLMEVCLRLAMDRILLSEVRGPEAYHFLRIAASGHPGSITTWHAGSCSQAFEQFALMVREAPAGAGMTVPEVKQLARDLIDIVVHIDCGTDGRYITDIHYDPIGRLERAAA